MTEKHLSISVRRGRGNYFGQFKFVRSEAPHSIQHLPKGTATCSLYLLSGILPLKAVHHKYALTLLYNILSQPGSIEREVLITQLVTKDMSSNSWAVYIRKLLHQFIIARQLLSVYSGNVCTCKYAYSAHKYARYARKYACCIYRMCPQGSQGQVDPNH